jgi:UDP-GlcNAc:undecaprenyl-phosphate GlcNAc-1-phosphate transferase
VTTLSSATPVAGVALSALALAAVVTEPLRRLALRTGLTDRPAAHKAHVKPTPYLGGVAVVLGTAVPALLIMGHWNPRATTLVLAGIVIAALGLVDDMKSLPPRLRLAVEAVCAGAVVAAGARMQVFGSFWPDAIVTGLWIVVLTNSFNLLDNMDGAAASTATAITAVLSGYALLTGRMGIGMLLACLAAACGGFLCHNWPPARIFMGDAGSLFIGFVIASASVFLVGPAKGLSAMAGLILITFIATVDTTLVMISRSTNGRSWLQGGTDHVSHRLRRLGLGNQGVALVLFTSAGATSLLGVLVAGRVLPAPVLMVAVAASAATVVGLLLRVSVYADLVEREPTPNPEYC